MKILPTSHYSTQRPKCQNNVCRVATKSSSPLPPLPPQPQLPPPPQSRIEVDSNTNTGASMCQSDDCECKCKCKCRESEKRVVVIQNNNTTTTNHDEILPRSRRDYGGGYCYPSACYLDPCSSLGYVSPIRGPCWNVPLFQPGFSGYGGGYGGYGGGNFCAARPPF